MRYYKNTRPTVKKAAFGMNLTGDVNTDWFDNWMTKDKNFSNPFQSFNSDMTLAPDLDYLYGKADKYASNHYSDFYETGDLQNNIDYFSNLGVVNRGKDGKFNLDYSKFQYNQAEYDRIRELEQLKEAGFETFGDVGTGVQGLLGVAGGIGAAALGLPPQLGSTVGTFVGKGITSITGNQLNKSFNESGINDILNMSDEYFEKYAKYHQDKSEAGNRRGYNVSSIFAKGGRMTGNVNSEYLEPIASDTKLIHGSRHEQGGVNINPQVEAEGGEVINDNKIFSDRLKYINGKTYAEVAESLSRKKGKFESMIDSKDSVEKDTAIRMIENIDMDLEKLFQHQEVNKPVDNNNIMAYGGEIGGPDKVITADDGTQLRMYNGVWQIKKADSESFENLDVPITRYKDLIRGKTLADAATGKTITWDKKGTVVLPGFNIDPKTGIPVQKGSTLHKKSNVNNNNPLVPIEPMQFRKSSKSSNIPIDSLDKAEVKNIASNLSISQMDKLRGIKIDNTSKPSYGMLDASLYPDLGIGEFQDVSGDAARVMKLAIEGSSGIGKQLPIDKMSRLPIDNLSFNPIAAPKGKNIQSDIGALNSDLLVGTSQDPTMVARQYYPNFDQMPLAQQRAILGDIQTLEMSKFPTNNISSLTQPIINRPKGQFYGNAPYADNSNIEPIGNKISNLKPIYENNQFVPKSSSNISKDRIGQINNINTPSISTKLLDINTNKYPYLSNEVASAFNNNSLDYSQEFSLDRPNSIIEPISNNTDIASNSKNNIFKRGITISTPSNINWNEVAANTAPLIDNIGNAIITRRTPNIPMPRLQQASNLDLTYDINPQLNDIDRTIAAYNKDINNTTRSSAVANSRRNAILSTALDKKGALYAEKRNAEAQLKNKQQLINKEIEANNLEKLDNYDMSKVLRKAGMQQDYSANLSNLSDDITNMIERKDANTYQNLQLDYIYKNAKETEVWTSYLDSGTFDNKILTDGKTEYDRLKTKAGKELYKARAKSLGFDVSKWN